MTTVIVTPRARLDLFAIIRRLAADAGLRVADKWDRRLWAAIDRLAAFPGSGAPRPRLGKNVRIIPVAPYIVIYRHALGEAVAIVLRVLHGRRKITRRSLRP